uniref:EMI domain-containing protein n=1 Tax=Astatotilapia calliptera TaxID=8154 RepID=A0A3P8QWR1_ASTCA
TVIFTVSCVVEDGVETYVKPDYHPCSWGSGQCSRVVVYRTYMRPRYKVAYKMVTEMDWKCCHGYSGADCNIGPVGGGGTQISTTRPQPGQGGGTTTDNEKMRQLEEKIRSLTKNLQDLQSTMSTMNERLQEEGGRNGLGGGSSGGRNPADAAQPEIKETIHSIQTKLDQLDNRTQAHDKTLVSINNHLVNGKGNELEGGVSGGSLSEGRLNSLKEEILSELERRVSLSCSSCQAGVEDLRKQQQQDRERIRALEKQMNAMDVQYRQSLDGLRRDVVRSQGCCDIISDLQDRVTDAERKISTASENFDILQNRLDRELSGQGGQGLPVGGETGGHGRDAMITEERLNNRLKDLERRVNSTMQKTEESCSYLENDVKDYFHRELDELRSVFLERFDDQADRIADVELDVEQVKNSIRDHDKRLSKLENTTSQMNWRLEKCGCVASEQGGGGEGRGRGDGGYGGGSWGAGGGGSTGEGKEGGNRGDGGGTWGAGGGGSTGGGGRWGGTGGGLPGTGGERDNSTKKSLEWRVVANEDQIRHFNTQLKDLSMSGDSLYDKVSHTSGSAQQIITGQIKNSLHVQINVLCINTLTL